ADGRHVPPTPPNISNGGTPTDLPASSKDLGRRRNTGVPTPFRWPAAGRRSPVFAGPSPPRVQGGPPHREADPRRWPPAAASAPLLPGRRSLPPGRWGNDPRTPLGRRPDPPGI